MKKNNIIKKLGSSLLVCLTMVLWFNANTASCYYFNQPKAPCEIDKYKFFK